MVKRDVYIAIILFALGIVTRIPFMSKVFYYWDCVNYALALEDFNVAEGRPGAPGYFLYIMLGKLMHLVIDDPNACFVWLSVVASGLGAALIFVLGNMMFSRCVGLSASLLFLTSPLVWFHGEIAFPYVLEGTLSVALAWLCFQTLGQPRLAYGIGGALLLAVLGGLRPQGMIFLFPLWIYGIHKLRQRDMLLTLCGLGMFVLMWVVPMVILSGGWLAYYDAIRTGSSTLQVSSIKEFGMSVWENSEKYFRYLMKACTIGLGVLVFGIPLLVKHKKVFEKKSTRILLAWIIGPSCFFILIYLGNPGHLFTCLFAYFLVVAIVIEHLTRNNKTLGSILLGICIFVNIGVFLVDTHPDRVWHKKTWYRASDLQKKNQYVLNKIEYIRENLDPKSTILLADTGGSGHVPQLAYYLPQFRTYSFLAVRAQGQRSVLYSKGDKTLAQMDIDSPFLIPTEVKTIVLFDSKYEKAFDFSSGAYARIKLSDGVEIVLTYPESNNYLEVDYQSLSLVRL
ncbi:hypothetical protein IID04_05730 [PVC group bacterium]|nr:hypothetical protein [PVC group bacterium]